MIYFQLKKDEKSVYSNLPETLDISNTKTFDRFFEGYNVIITATERDIKLLSSGKHIKTALTICQNLAEIIEEIEGKQNNRYTILSHNLITTHAHLQDVIENIAPEEVLAQAKDHNEQLSIIEDYLKLDISASSEAVLSVIKRVVDIQSQIEGFKILSKERKLDYGDHNILKVIQNIIHPFYQDLAGNNISIKWHIEPSSAEENKIKTDYKVFNVILHHLLTNAVKYAKPYSNIHIDYNFQTSELSFGMKSIRIEQNEVEKIFELEYCGKNVPKSLAGEGVGMYMVRKASDLLNIRVSIETDYTAHVEDVEGIKYSPNRFKLKML